jgi:hypothetical protein
MRPRKTRVNSTPLLKHLRRHFRLNRIQIQTSNRSLISPLQIVGLKLSNGYRSLITSSYKTPSSNFSLKLLKLPRGVDRNLLHKRKVAIGLFQTATTSSSLEETLSTGTQTGG